MIMRKKLVSVGGSKALIIPYEFLEYYKLHDEQLIAFDVDIRENILILKPVLAKIKK